MENIINRKEIAKGVFLSSVTDRRFKMNQISVFFISQLDAEKTSLNAILPNILTKSNGKYRTFAELNNKLSSLYSAQLSGNSGSTGDSQVLRFSITAIDNKYSLENEDITGEALDILTGCLFDPVLDGESFPEESVELEKQNQIDAINAEINDKQLYASNQLKKLLCDGEPYAFNPSGTVENVRSANGKSLYQAYKDMLETHRIEIICCGRSDFNDVKNKLISLFSEKKRGDIINCSSSFSPVKVSPAEEIEKMEVVQSKLAIGFKSENTDKFANSVMSAVFGGTPTSKLFMNVREKLSLCYYCWSGVNPLKGIMTIKCGVESQNIEKAKEEILRQFDSMKAGDFTDEEFSAAKMSSANDYKTVNDTISGVTSWYFTRIYTGDMYTPEEALERMMKVTREDVIKAAADYKLDSVYVLTGNENEGE